MLQRLLAGESLLGVDHKQFRYQVFRFFGNGLPKRWVVEGKISSLDFLIHFLDCVCLERFLAAHQAVHYHSNTAVRCSESQRWEFFLGFV